MLPLALNLPTIKTTLGPRYKAVLGGGGGSISHERVTGEAVL